MSTLGFERPEDALRAANTAMHRAKSLGRSRRQVFDTEMHSHAASLLRLETDLQRAVERGEYRVHYQPILSLADGEIFAFEALVRWLHPERELVSPAEFITVAEETGMI